MNGLCNINIELTSRCNKNCWCCGRRKREQENPSVKNTYGDMSFDLLKIIASQTPSDIVVQLHNNGEPLLYPRFGEAVRLFQRQIVGIDTNGKLILEKASEIIGNLDTMAISIIQDDPEADEQCELIKHFLLKKQSDKPLVILRLNGEVDRRRYEAFGVPIATRILHSPMGSFNYTNKATIPEIGICREFLSHLSIDRFGNVSICVRYDPYGKGVLGNIYINTLEELWNGRKRMIWYKQHVCGKRNLVPLCSTCEFWGIPTGW